MLSVDRTRLANDLLECFCADNAESMLSVGCTNAISAPHQSLPLLHRFHQWLIHIPDLSFYLWGCSLMIVTGTTLKNIFHAQTSVSFLLLIGILGLIVCLLQYAIGRRIGRFFCSSIEAGQALGQKNTAFAIWIAATYLHPLSTVGPGCYILWQNIINSIEIWKRGKYEA